MSLTATETAPAEAELASEQAAPAAAGSLPAGGEALVADELLVEEVSIDGMCGVY